MAQKRGQRVCVLIAVEKKCMPANLASLSPVALPVQCSLPLATHLHMHMVVKMICQKSGTGIHIF